VEGTYREVLGAVTVEESVPLAGSILHITIGWLVVKITILIPTVLDLKALAVGISQTHLVTCDWISVRVLADEIG
jgi:hypothetical protein